jgi:hypothetical protein
MPRFEYTTDVITHGLLGGKENELDRAELERRLNAHGADGWELDSLVRDVALQNEQDGHLLIFRREVA